MDCSDSLAAVASGIVKGKLGNPLRLFSGDYLEALHDSRNTLVLQTTVLALRIFTDNHNIQSLVPAIERGGRGEEGGRGGREGRKKVESACTLRYTCGKL